MDEKRDFSGKIFLYWISFGLTFFAFCVIWSCVPFFVTNISPSFVQDNLVSSIRSYADSVKCAQYVVSLFSFPFVFIGMVWLCAKVFKTLHCPNAHRFLGAICLFIQLILGFLIYSAVQSSSYAYFDSSLVCYAAVGFLVFSLLWVYRHPIFSLFPAKECLLGLAPPFKLFMKVLLYALIGFVSLNYLSSSIFDSKMFPLINILVSGHIPFTWADVVSVSSGKTPLVNYFGQYINLLPYLFVPWFKAFGQDMLSFSLLMTLLNALIAFFVFRALLSLTRNLFWTTVFYVTWMAIAFYSPVGERGIAPSTNFNYFAVGPLRYIGPFVLLFLSTHLIRSRSANSLTILFSIGTWVMMNNLDWGIPAMGALLASIIATDSNRLIPKPKRLSQIMARFFGAIAINFIGFILLTYLRAHEWPQIARFFDFQIAHSVLGITTLGTPELGVDSICFFILMTCLSAGIFRVIEGTNVTEEGRLLNFLMIYSGIFGGGVFFYYINRSHPYVLIATFPIVGFSLVLLVYLAVKRPLTGDFSWKSFVQRLEFIPGVFLLIAFSSCFSELYGIRPEDRIAYFKLSSESFDDRRAQLKRFLEPNLKDRAVWFTGPFGDLYASDLHLQNKFIANVGESLMLTSQIELGCERAEKDHITAIVGPAFYPIWDNKLSALGFRKEDKIRLDQEEWYLWKRD